MIQIPFLALAIAAIALSACTKMSGPRAAAQAPRTPAPGVTLYVSTDNDTQAECNEFRNKLPENYFQDFVEVPEDWNNPEGHKIKIFYYGRMPADGQTPLLFLNGGPAASSHGAYEHLEKDGTFEARYKKHHLFFMDQRGTGCSGLYPVGSKENLARLRHYGSRSIVRDAEAIRKKIGYPNWKILGQSYGGDIAYRYLIVAPEGVSEAYIHGSVLGENQATDMGPRIRSQKRLAEAYFEKYPQDRELIRKIRSLIPDNYCITNRISGGCGSGILDGAVYLLSYPAMWEEMHNWFTGMLYKRNGKGDVVFDDILINWTRRTFLANQNFAGGAAIGELENVLDSHKDCDAETTKLKSQGDDPNNWVFNECRLFRSLTSEENIVFDGFAKDPLRIRDLKKALAENPEVKVHVYIGKFDALTPVEALGPMQRGLGNRVHYTVFESGHDGFKTEESLWEDISAEATREFPQ